MFRHRSHPENSVSPPPILCVTRRVPGPDAAFRQALRLAERRGASLTLLHVHRTAEAAPGPVLPTGLPEMLAQARRLVGGVELLVVGREGDWRREVEALDWGRWGLALKVPEPEPRLRRFVGRTLDQRLARAPGIPVWFVPPSLGAEVRVVLAAVDVAHRDHAILDRKVLEAGFALSNSAQARYFVVHVWSPTLRGTASGRTRGWLRSLERDRRKRLARLVRERAGRTPQPLLVRGVPAAALRRTAHRIGADLLVLGTQRRDGWDGLLAGNLAERFLGLDGLAVFLLKPGSEIPVFPGPELVA